MFYIVMAHPDDEVYAWSMIENLPDPTYEVFVAFTRGENTNGCATAEQGRNRQEVGEDATLVEGFTSSFGGVVRPHDPRDTKTGPFQYQGPRSPVGQPDRKERHPYGNPWVGQGTEACADARVASWHWFLDDMHALDGSGASFEIAPENDPWLDDDYQGRFCPAGHRGRGEGQAASKGVACADVWANETGARVAFELPNGPYVVDPETGWEEIGPAGFGVEDVSAAFGALRQHRSHWGLPVLKESGVLSVLPGATHPEHGVVADAVFNLDLGAGPQYGAAADPSDPYFQAAGQIVQPENPATLVQYNLVDPITEDRLGAFVVNYGWLESTYRFVNSSTFYWRVG